MSKKNVIYNSCMFYKKRMYELDEDDLWLEFLDKLKLLQETSCSVCYNFQQQIHGCTIRYQDRDSNDVSFF
jgi:hypothetical protein